MRIRNLLIGAIVIASVVAPSATFAATRPAHSHHKVAVKHPAARRGVVRSHAGARGVWLGKHTNAKHVVNHKAARHGTAKKHAAAKRLAKHTVARHNTVRKHRTTKK